MDLRFSQTSRLNLSTARDAFEQAAARSVAPLAADAGRGIVIPGGGEKYLPGAYVAAALLREQGCALPIELWHLGVDELPPRWLAPLARLNVTPVDAVAVRWQSPTRRLGGYELKAYALVHSRFSEVLLLDADNVPVRNPSVLFDTPEYHRFGAIFWPDYGASRAALATGTLSEHHPIWSLTGLDYRGDREFESGQLCVDRRRCGRELLLALWLNEHSDFWYRYVWGDKDTFQLAWRKLGRDWAMPARGPIDLHGMAMGQCDFEGRVLFQHRNGAKWSLHDNPRIPGFVAEERCLGLLGELRAELSAQG